MSLAARNILRNEIGGSKGLSVLNFDRYHQAICKNVVPVMAASLSGISHKQDAGSLQLILLRGSAFFQECRPSFRLVPALVPNLPKSQQVSSMTKGSDSHT